MKINKSAFLRMLWTVGAFVILGGKPASADAIRYSVTGELHNDAGPISLTGASGEVSDEWINLGTYLFNHLPGISEPTDFQLQIQIDDGLPPIHLSGTIGWIGYNPDMPVLNSLVTSTASPEQIALYPEIFRRLLAHPDWLHTTSFGSNPPTPLIATVHVEDPNEPRPTPEPSTVVAFAVVMGGAGWRSIRGRRRSGAMAVGGPASRVD